MRPADFEELDRRFNRSACELEVRLDRASALRERAVELVREGRPGLTDLLVAFALQARAQEELQRTVSVALKVAKQFLDEASVLEERVGVLAAQRRRSARPRRRASPRRKGK